MKLWHHSSLKYVTLVSMLGKENILVVAGDYIFQYHNNHHHYHYVCNIMMALVFIIIIAMLANNVGCGDYIFQYHNDHLHHHYVHLFNHPCHVGKGKYMLVVVIA